MKRSKWFPISQLPSAAGWYEIKALTEADYPMHAMTIETKALYALGRWWFLPEDTQVRQWRGLAEKPE